MCLLSMFTLLWYGLLAMDLAVDPKCNWNLVKCHQLPHPIRLK